ncbi:hypothetical protein SPRG_20560 [Saprolegnia parasitica CBS 223.65]|uniref:Myosin motor domain-containing protein n=1 Tax=Saprolegnia parasitica (strain CBS 223.65) TaxID=695850 RepID=A0A067CBQ7_SAPPC|nr:hypothetical protein SPRG_20560 [Saprolegnia parasitica CBS 223.65]KDO26615.1 hypothetical protein SPRG_20560 [Saprolegnia parasitica CBS 223.65]|eukprot:XP_012202792.1 hypothetical protein SPRG_20560 [Saprolegnia parasitica CBS 223.65]
MTSTFGDQSMGSLVWVPHETEVWKKAQVVEKPTEATVTVRLIADGDDYDPEDGVVKTFDIAEIAKLAGEVSATAMPICNSFEKLGVEDMCTLNHLHEPAVLKNLQLRHAQSIPYTYTGQICIAVNPYKWLDLYGKELYQKYLDQPRSELSPHPFALSASAYLDMRKLHIEQSILVSGESGAGKTETVKIMMHHLASVSGVGEKGSTVIDQVLKSNPLLEAFGNAKTKRNDNSSRFGKFAQLQFDASGYLIGARCETYLLEKSRVVGQTQGERNYHIFYQVFSLASELKKSLFLEGNVADYNFVKVGAGSRVDNTDDSVFLQETKDAMDTIGIDDREQHGIFEIVSAILNLGEVEFRKETVEKCSVLSLERVEAVAALLNTAASALQVTLCQRKMTAGGETYMIPLNVDQAADLRDAFAKGMYSHLFDWLVGRINRAICSTKNTAIRVQTLYRMHVAQKTYRRMQRGTIRLQTRVRGMQARKRFVVLVQAERARKAALKRAAEAKAKADALLAADAMRAAAEKEKVKRMEEAKRLEEEEMLRSSHNHSNQDDEPIETSSEGSDGDRLSASSQSILTSAAARVAEAEAAAVEAQKAAMAALTHNRVIQAENESLRAKMAAYVAEHADAELLRENERLKHQVLTLQSKLVRAQEVSLISAKVVDSRITFREGRQFVEYKLQIETNSRGTLFVWHRYSTFRNLATTLQTKNGYRRKDIPDLPNKQLFGNFTDRIIQERIQKLNEFLEAATNTDYLQWGIRVDQDTCSIAIGRESMALTHNSSMASEDTSRESVSRESFSIRESLSSKFSLRRSKN